MIAKRFRSFLFDFTMLLFAYFILWAGVVYFAPLSVSLEAPFLNAPLLALKQLPFPYPKWFQYSALAAIFIPGVLLFFNPFREKKGTYGDAHWATEKETKKMGLRDEAGLILAVKGNGYIRTNEPLCVLVYAPPGSGKTAGIIIPSLISCGNSAIVHDPKGELFAKTSKRRSEFSKIIKFSPGERGSLRWNPLSKEELPEGWADIMVHVSRVSEVVIPDNPKNPGEHWPKAGRAFFMFWALYLIYRDGETSLPSVLKEPLKTDDIQIRIAEIIDEIKEQPRCPERVMLEGNSLLNAPEGEFGSIVSTFKTNLQVFFDERVAANMSGSDFKLADLRRERTTIYITVKNSDQSRLKNIMSLFFEICTFTMLHHEPTKDEFPVTAFLDEFVRMARMKELLEMPAIGRSYKFNAVYVCQSISQIIGIYTKEGADQLKNTCAYHVYFAQNEQAVAEEISKSIGDMTRNKISTSTGGKATLLKNKSEVNEGQKLILPQEIMSLPKGTVLICQQNNFETPVRANAAFWFKDSALSVHVEDVDYQEEQDSAPSPKPIASGLDEKRAGGLTVDPGEEMESEPIDESPIEDTDASDAVTPTESLEEIEVGQLEDDPGVDLEEGGGGEPVSGSPWEDPETMAEIGDLSSVAMEDLDGDEGSESILENLDDILDFEDSGVGREE